MRGAVVAFPDYTFYSTPQLLAAFSAGPARLRASLDELLEHDLHARPRGPATWSIHEIVLHVTDSELQGTYRMRKVWSEPGALLPGYNQDVWASALAYQRSNGEARELALALFALLREETAALLENAGAEDWRKGGVHPDYGSITLRNLLELYADHSERHVEQVLACRRLLGRGLEVEPLLERRLY